MPNKVTRRPMFRGRVDARNPMGILASSAKLANSVAMAHGGFRNPHPPVTYAADGLSLSGRNRPRNDRIQTVNPVDFGLDDGIASIDGGVGMIPSGPITRGQNRQSRTSSTGIGNLSLIASAEAAETQPVEMNSGIIATPAKTEEKITAASQDMDSPATESSSEAAAGTGDGDTSSVTKAPGTSFSEYLSKSLQPPEVAMTKLKEIAEGTVDPTAGTQKILSDQQTKLGDLQTRAKTEQENLRNLIGQSAGLKQDLAKNYENIVGQLEKNRKDPKAAADAVDFETVYKDTAKEMGFDPKDMENAYKDDKQQAFWLNLMKAGLAVAAGESSDPLSNLAKGLMVGLNEYGKDINRLNAQEREDRKEFRTALRQNLKSEKSTAIALATAENNWISNIASLDLQVANAQTSAQLAGVEEKRQLASQNLVHMQFEVGLANAIADSGIKVEELKQKSKDAQLDAALKIYSIAQSRATTYANALPDNIKDVAWMGSGFAIVNEQTGELVLTATGQKELIRIMTDSDTNFKATYEDIGAFSNAIMSSANATESVVKIYKNELKRQGQDVRASQVNIRDAIRFAYNLFGDDNDNGGGNTSGGSTNMSGVAVTDEGQIQFLDNLARQNPGRTVFQDTNNNKLYTKTPNGYVVTPLN